MARQANSPVFVSVEIDRKTFDIFNKIYSEMGTDFIETVQKELQKQLEVSLARKRLIFRQAYLSEENPPTVETKPPEVKEASKPK